MRAVADMMQQAAAGSQQVLSSIAPNGSDAGAAGASLLRDAMAEMERSFARVYDVAGSFMSERTFRPAGGPGHATSAANIVVIDGVGTTSIEVPGAQHTPHCSDLRRHDGASIPSESVRVVKATAFGSDAETFVVRVDASDDASPGVYHGQLLVEGYPDLVLGVTVHLIEDA